MADSIQECLVRDLPNYEGCSVRLRGWVRNKRSGKGLLFIILRDGSEEVQCVISEEVVGEDKFRSYEELGLESAIVVTGEVKKDARSPGGYELQVSDMSVIQAVQDYPITKKEHGIEFLMSHRHLWIRSRRQNAILKVRSEIQKHWTDFFYERKFYRVDAPIFTGTSCEGTTTLFPVDYHGDTAYLTQSGQLYNEATIFSLGRVYCFGPTFRAEKSKTRRHLLEFWMLEMEAAFLEHEENLRFQEELVVSTLEYVLSHCKKELGVLGRDTEPLERISSPFPRITYKVAVEKINAEMEGRDSPFHLGDDFGAPEETFLSRAYEKPLFVTNFPVQTKAFYMKEDPNQQGTVLAADLLAPEGYGEIIGGSQREDDLEVLRGKIKEWRLQEEAIQWYLDLRRFGTVPHSGFGIGLERVVAWVCGLQHIRESIPFPRMLHYLFP